MTPPRVRRPFARRHAVERIPVGRLERQHLPRRSERRLDLGERGRGAGGQHQFARLVVADPREARQVERARRLQWPAEAALGAAGDEFERLLGGERLADRLAQFVKSPGANRVIGAK